MQGSVVPLVDGGTEGNEKTLNIIKKDGFTFNFHSRALKCIYFLGFKGNVRVIYPGMSACIECNLDLYPKQVLCNFYQSFHIYL